jgi:hypothetical protein
MSSIPLPALSLKPVQVPDPLESQAKVMQMRDMMMQQKARQNELTMQNQEINDQKAATAAMKQALMNWEGKDYNAIYDQLPKLILQNGGSSKAAQTAQQKALQSKDMSSQIAFRDAETGDKKSQTIIRNGDLVSGTLTSVLGLPDEDFVTQLPTALQSLQQNGALDPQHAQMFGTILQGIQAGKLDPASAKQNVDLYRKSMMAASQQQKEALDKLELQTKQVQLRGQSAETDQKVRSNLAAQLAAAGSQAAYDQLLNDKVKSGELSFSQARQFPAQYDKDAVLQVGMTPHEQASLPVDKMEMKDWLSKNPGKGPSDFLTWKAHQTPNATIMMQNQLGSGPALDQSAERYAATGQLPSGFYRSPETYAAIIKRAAELHPEANIAVNQAIYGADKQSLGALQKNRDSVVAFENTAGKNLDLFLTQAKKVVDSGSPLLNTPLRMISKQLGGADYPAFNAARQVAINEIAKVTSNPGLTGQLSDAARKEVESFNPNNATLRQTFAVAQVLKQDMANRHDAYDQQIKEIQGRLGGTSATPAARGGAAPKIGQTRTFPNGKVGKWDGKGWVAQ